MKRLFFFLALSALFFSSCNYINTKTIGGNGSIKKEVRQVEGFEGVEVGGSIELIVRTDSGFKVEIETDDNLMQYIETNRSGNVLEVYTRRGFDLDPTKSVKVYVSAPEYKSLDASGACSINSENQLIAPSGLKVMLSGACRSIMDVRTPSFNADLSGASELTVTGETRDVSLEASGSSRIEAFQLLSENAEVDISGASHADVFASIKLNADASGASGVRYKGNANVSSNMSGASSIRKAD